MRETTAGIRRPFFLRSDGAESKRGVDTPPQKGDPDVVGVSGLVSLSLLSPVHGEPSIRLRRLSLCYTSPKITKIKL